MVFKEIIDYFFNIHNKNVKIYSINESEKLIRYLWTNYLCTNFCVHINLEINKLDYLILSTTII